MSQSDELRKLIEASKADLEAEDQVDREVYASALAELGQLEFSLKEFVDAGADYKVMGDPEGHPWIQLRVQIADGSQQYWNIYPPSHKGAYSMLAKQLGREEPWNVRFFSPTREVEFDDIRSLIEHITPYVARAIAEAEHHSSKLDEGSPKSRP